MPQAPLSHDQNAKEHVKTFWDHEFQNKSLELASTAEVSLEESKHPLDRKFWSLIGDVRGLDILEIGCGLGHDTLRYAKMGARVVSIDISDVAVEQVKKRIENAGLSADVRVMDAFDVPSLNKKFDMIVGRFVLHHLEPFDEMSRIFASCLKQDGRMVFIENNASNPLLIFARNHLAGRYGIPKHGDNDEHPLTREEVAVLGKHFKEVKCHFPYVAFLRKINVYIFRGKKIFLPFTFLLSTADDALGAVFPGFRAYSYVQIVFAARPVAAQVQ